MIVLLRKHNNKHSLKTHINYHISDPGVFTRKKNLTKKATNKISKSL
jgi:hypothetical protein